MPTGLWSPVVDAIIHGSTIDPTQSSDVPAVIPQMTLSVISTAGRRVRIDVNVEIELRGGDDGTISLYRNGTIITGSTRTVNHDASRGALDPAGKVTTAVSLFTIIITEEPGTHTYAAYWSCSAGALRAVGTERTFAVSTSSSFS